MPPHHSTDKKRRLSRALAALFLFALFMGPGPGLYLINDYASRGGLLLGMPALYTWAVFWFLVEAGVVVAAYLLIWKGDDQ